MMIVGQVSSKTEAKEMEFIYKAHIVGKRARDLAGKLKKGNEMNGKRE
jgi:hypothetical protein